MYCTFPTVRLALLILLKSAPFPSSAGSSISARSSCRSELSSSVNAGSFNLISLQREGEREASEWLFTVRAWWLGSPGSWACENNCNKCSVCGHKHSGCLLLFPSVNSPRLHPGSAAKPQIIPLHGWDVCFLEIPPDKKLIPLKWSSFEVSPWLCRGFSLCTAVQPPWQDLTPGEEQAHVAYPMPSIPSMGECTAPSLPWGQALEPGWGLPAQLGLQVLQVGATDGLQQHQQRRPADGNLQHGKSAAGIGLVLECPRDGQHRDQNLCVWIHPELLRLFEWEGLLNICWKTDEEKIYWFFSSFPPPLCPLAGLFKDTLCLREGLHV